MKKLTQNINQVFGGNNETTDVELAGEVVKKIPEVLTGDALAGYVDDGTTQVVPSVVVGELTDLLNGEVTELTVI